MEDDRIQGILFSKSNNIEFNTAPKATKKQIEKTKSKTTKQFFHKLTVKFRRVSRITKSK